MARRKKKRKLSGFEMKQHESAMRFARAYDFKGLQVALKKRLKRERRR